MASKQISVKVAGAKEAKIMDVDTVGDARKELGLGDNYSATVNGEPAKDDAQLASFSFVAFSEAVKGN